MFFLLLMQEHPFFTLHDSKDTDVASFVKVILDDWWAPAGAPAHQGRRGPLSKTNQWPTPVFLFFFFFLFFSNSLEWQTLMYPHTTGRRGGGGREWPKDGQQPSSTGVGEWWWYELCTVKKKKNPTGEVWFSPPSFLCVHLFNTANMNWIRLCFCLVLFLFFAPLPLFISLFRNGQSQPLLCLWHILYEYFEFHLQKNQQLMCMLCIESYICICMFFFLIMQSFDTVYQVWIFTRRGPYLSDQIASGEHAPPGSTLMGIGPAQSGLQLSPEPWEAPEPRQKHVRNVKGHILDREELRVIPRSLRNVKRPVSSIWAAATPPSLLFFFLGY